MTVPKAQAKNRSVWARPRSRQHRNASPFATPMPPAPDDERHLLSGISAISKYAFDETVASGAPAIYLRCRDKLPLVRLNGPPETLRVLAVAQQAADTMATTCPQAVSAEPTAQLEAVEQAIDAVAPLPRQRRSASAGFCAVTPQRKARASIIAARVVCFRDRLRAV